MQAPDFKAAAVRHFADAQMLQKAGRLPNADHLTGFAAECALKSLVALHMGGQVSGGYAHWPASHRGGRRISDHLGDTLWVEVATLANTRSAPDEVRVLLTNDPFKGWEVSDRYASGQHISGSIVESHIDGASNALKALESFELWNMTGVA